MTPPFQLHISSRYLNGIPWQTDAAAAVRVAMCRPLHLPDAVRLSDCTYPHCGCRYQVLAPPSCILPAGRYILLTLFLAVTLEAFEAKYDPNAVRLGAKGGGMTSLMGSLRSGLSSLRSGLSSRGRCAGRPVLLPLHCMLLLYMHFAWLGLSSVRSGLSNVGSRRGR